MKDSLITLSSLYYTFSKTENPEKTEKLMMLS